MNGFDAASLTDALLVVKGTAAPGASQPQRSRRIRTTDGRASVALRLDEGRRRRLKIAAAYLRKSTQAMLLAALDHYFERVVPEPRGRGMCLSWRARR